MLPTRSQLQQKLTELDFHKIGIARLSDWDHEPPTDLQTWLDNGYQADLAWMNAPRRQDVRSLLPEAQSIICVALNYYTDHDRDHHPDHAKISRYGWGRDYHKVLHKRLKAFSLWLESLDPSIKTRYYADTGPIQDKLWAQRSGLGWVSKNSNVITREFGSWVFLGEILTNLNLEPDAPHTAHCGTCTRCIDACPTGAIVSPHTVDANRCIAYHTIENRSPTLPEAIAQNLNGWVAGCDICQDVCPWNQRFATPTHLPDFQPYEGNVNPTLQELAEISQEEYDRRFPASALRRIKPDMLRRNAIANLNNAQSLESPDSSDILTSQGGSE
jgi:epoxyqueuosine reductase